MSFDIAVIVSNKSYVDNFEKFAHSLGIVVEKEGEVSFKNVANWQKSFLDVVFGPKGTLVCAPIREYNVAAASQASQVALLSLSQDFMFNLECAENGSMTRIYTEFDGVVRRNVKLPLKWESKDKNYVELLSDCVKEFTGKDFGAYQNEVAIRYGIR